METKTPVQGKGAPECFRRLQRIPSSSSHCPEGRAQRHSSCYTTSQSLCIYMQLHQCTPSSESAIAIHSCCRFPQQYSFRRPPDGETIMQPEQNPARYIRTLYITRALHVARCARQSRHFKPGPMGILLSIHCPCSARERAGPVFPAAGWPLKIGLHL